jgi:glycosyltransferase involved in cell wall biosynthesis
MRDLSFSKKKNLFSKTDARYLKRYTAFFIRKAESIAVMNPYLKKSILKTYAVTENKVAILNMGIDKVFKPCGSDKSEKIKRTFTEEKEYFLFFATLSSDENIVTMLKAFSIFKKWQKSNMKLIILFSAPGKENSIKDLSSYKYRDDVRILTAENNEATAEIIASAYAVIHLPAIEIMETEGLSGLVSGVPLISIDNDFCQSMYKDAALYSLPAEKGLSEKMMILYKDEKIRNELIARGKEVAAVHSWQNAARILWQTIQPVAAL